LIDVDMHDSLADPATAVCFTLSALRPARRWRGRTYQ
jgi:hypothetical protein